MWENGHGKADFMAFSYYSSSTVTTHTENHEVVGGNLSSGPKNPYIATSDWGWQMDPTGYRYFLNVMYDRYQVPLFDVENGLGAYDEVVVEDGVERVHDPYRIDFLRDHIRNLRAAIDEDGVDIFGYTTWGTLDLVRNAGAVDRPRLREMHHMHSKQEVIGISLEHPGHLN